MTTYPEDVMKAAQSVYDALESVTERDRATPRATVDVKVIASAILAERERCATIADMEEAAFCDPSIRDSHRSRGARDASARIAAAIREGSEAESARFRGLLAEAGKALAFYGDVSKYKAPLTGGFGDLWSDCGTRARTVAITIEEALK